MNGARDRVLEATKRPALRLLHSTRAGEALLVRLYLEAERHAEQALAYHRDVDALETRAATS